MILIVDKTHIASVFICEPVINYISDDMSYVIRYKDNLFHGMEYYQTPTKHQRNFLLLGGAGVASIIKTDFNKLTGMMDLPRNKVSFVGLEDHWGGQFAHLLQADFKKNNWTIEEFFARPETQMAVPRFRIYNRKELVAKAISYTPADTNIKISEPN